MYDYPEPIEKLIEAFAKLPGIGPKTAQRLAFYVLKSKNDYPEELGKAVLEIKQKIKLCQICGNYTDQDHCSICRSNTRNKEVICVVEDPKDVLALEKTNEYRGLYHVLHGAISPIDGIGPEQLMVRELLKRLETGEIKEIILATNSTIEGDTTSLYLAKLVSPLNIKVTRIAQGIPVGGDIDYADEITLSKAFIGRREISF
ncbi:MAG: recombination protein RecR [Clostridia bacterium]|jgi:recombination protein RecR|nr:recombination protein RecR [Clostridia bacterium]